MRTIKYIRGSRTALQSLGLTKFAKEFAPGIPDRKTVQKLPEVAKPQDWDFALQHHTADRAGEHLDLRLVDPETGHAHSWALPAAVMPEPGRSVLAVPQPTHTKEYALEFGKGTPRKIEEGYGKGTVKMQDQQKAEVFHSKAKEEGTRVRFNLYRGTHPEEYALIRTRDGNDRLVNKTLSKSRTEHLPLGGKPKLKEISPDTINFGDDSQVMMPKLDGAHTLIDLKTKGRIPRLFSYRLGKRSGSGIIEHTHKVPSFLTQRVPDDLERTVLRAEAIAVHPNGKALAAKNLAGMLNASVPNSRAKQKELKTEITPVAFDVVKYKGKDVKDMPYEQRYDLLKDIGRRMHIQVADVATTAVQKKSLLQKIEAGRHPLTTEGVILRSKTNPQLVTKAKFRPDHDVVVRNIFPSTNEERAGGFEYSWTPRGPIAGRVGTGFNHPMLKDMLHNPDKYKGRVAKVQAETKYESGALGKASFQEWHLDKGKSVQAYAKAASGS